MEMGDQSTRDSHDAESAKDSELSSEPSPQDDASSSNGEEAPERPHTDIGAFIREQRSLAELSLRKLSEKAGVSNPYLSQIERGLRKPSADILQQLAKALQVSVETMFVQAGMLESTGEKATSDVESTIRHATELNEEQRKALLGVYRSFIAANGAMAEAEDATFSGQVSDEDE